MKCIPILSLVVGLFFTVQPLRTFAAPELVSVSLSNAKVTVRVPDQWQHTLVQVATSPPTVDMVAPNNFPLRVKITFEGLEASKAERTVTDAERVVSQAMDRIATTQSVEKKVVLRPLTSELGPASYAVITDASLIGKSPLPAGSYLYLSAGAILAEKFRVMFSIFSNETDSEQYRQAMQVITTGLSVQ